MARCRARRYGADMKQRREWPVSAWLPAMTTLQALGVIIIGVLLGGFLPRYDLGAGFGSNLGNAVVALGLGIAAFSPKKPSRRERRRGAALRGDHLPGDQ